MGWGGGGGGDDDCNRTKELHGMVQGPCRRELQHKAIEAGFADGAPQHGGGNGLHRRARDGVAPAPAQVVQRKVPAAHACGGHASPTTPPQNIRPPCAQREPHPWCRTTHTTQGTPPLPTASCAVKCDQGYGWATHQSTGTREAQWWRPQTGSRLTKVPTSPQRPSTARGAVAQPGWVGAGGGGGACTRGRKRRKTRDSSLHPARARHASVTTTYRIDCSGRRHGEDKACDVAGQQGNEPRDGLQGL